jgi:hypothetical protein
MHHDQNFGKKNSIMKFEVFTEVTITVLLFWFVTPCRHVALMMETVCLFETNLQVTTSQELKIVTYDYVPIVWKRYTLFQSS